MFCWTEHREKTVKDGIVDLSEIHSAEEPKTFKLLNWSYIGNKIENYSVYIKLETTKKGKIQIWGILG